MRTQPLTLASLLLIGCFALTLLSFAYFTKKEAALSPSFPIECSSSETANNSELINESVSRQFLMAVFTK